METYLELFLGKATSLLNILRDVFRLHQTYRLVPLQKYQRL